MSVIGFIDEDAMYDSWKEYDPKRHRVSPQELELSLDSLNGRGMEVDSLQDSNRNLDETYWNLREEADSLISENVFLSAKQESGEYGTQEAIVPVSTAKGQFLVAIIGGMKSINGEYHPQIRYVVFTSDELQAAVGSPVEVGSQFRLLVMKLVMNNSSKSIDIGRTPDGKASAERILDKLSIVLS